jgi:carboxyl-terminal processing protease
MKSSKRGIFLLVAVLGISAVLGGLYGPAVRATAVDTGDLQQTVKDVAHVLAVVQQNYAEPVDADKVIYDGAIPGMLRVLDPHSNFFDPRQYALLKEEQHGKYYGVGMTVATRENHTVVVAPFFNSPAFKAGIRPGDVISKVDGKICEGLTTTQVADMLKGPKGTDVHITLTRQGWTDPIEVTVTRDQIPRPGVEYSTLLRPGVGYVKVSAFNETTGRELSEALHELDAQHLSGIILDLRGNPGGLLNEAVEVSEAFLDRNDLVVSYRGRTSPERRFMAVRGSGGLNVPVVVLINGQSASASEIVAGALQDHDRALIVGETSFGKGLVQTQFPLSDDTAILLTTFRYYTPSGRLIQRDYKNTSLYDYHYNPHPPKAPEVKSTDSGRQVLGGGGITPDVVFAEPKYDKFQQLLLSRNVFFPFAAGTGVGDFTRFYLGQRPEVTKKFEVDDAVMHQFRVYLDQQKIHYTEPDLKQNLPWIQRSIQREVLTSLFGQPEGYRVAIEEDPQVLKAIDLIPQAKALYENSRKIIAERHAAGAARP